MSFKQRAADELATTAPRKTLSPIMRKLVSDSAARLSLGPKDATTKASEARAYAIDHLEELHEQFRAKAEARGIKIHRAATAEEARNIIHELLGDSKRIAKSKSMVAEEIGLTPSLRAAGMEVLETDIGEYIIDIEGRGPSHITAPALHLHRGQIKDLLESAGYPLPDDDPTLLSQTVRDIVAEFFSEVDAGITGINVAIASSGRGLIVENEGNVTLGLSVPKLHIAVTGIEKVVADEEAAFAVLQVLAPSATAQPFTSFTHIFGEPLAGQERHIVFVDNGRSRIQKDKEFRDILKCVRCGACMNTCPVYRSISGIPYSSPYMGPIGAVLSPLLDGGEKYRDLAFGSSLCGACTEICPVGIPLHKMLLEHRARAVTEGHTSFAERATWKGWASAFSGGTRLRAATTMGRLAAGVGSKAPSWMTGGRSLPSQTPTRDPAMLTPTGPAIAPAFVTAEELLPKTQTGSELFAARVADLGAVVVAKHKKKKGDLMLTAKAAIASTGSVLLTGENALRKPLLEAGRIIVNVDPATIVDFPEGLAPIVAETEEDIVILTGTSRTADVEKLLVRGIHGPEDLIIVMRAAG